MVSCWLVVKEILVQTLLGVNSKEQIFLGKKWIVAYMGPQYDHICHHPANSIIPVLCTSTEII